MHREAGDHFGEPGMPVGARHTFPVQAGEAVEALLGGLEFIAIDLLAFERTDRDRLVEPAARQRIVRRAQAEAMVQQSLEAGDVATDLVQCRLIEDDPGAGAELHGEVAAVRQGR